VCWGGQSTPKKGDRLDCGLVSMANPRSWILTSIISLQGLSPSPGFCHGRAEAITNLFVCPAGLLAIVDDL
jgi:hypothetical protein